MNNTLIIGMPKSGTSALYTSIKKAGTYLLSIYEISNNRQLQYFRDHPGPKVAKMLLPRFFRMNATFAGDEQTVLIVRDPRDVVVSWLLFRPFLHGNTRNHGFMTDFVELIKKKEADPHGVAIQDLLEVCRSHGVYHQRPEHHARMFELEDKLTATSSNLETIRYEDFVQGKTAGLAAALGLGELNHADLAAYNRHNQRAGRFGSWRHWFTPEDVQVCRPLFDPYLQKWGYGTDDWRLSDEPWIDPQTSSEYIVRNAEKLQASPPSRGTLLQPQAYDAARIAMLEGAADDRREPFMVELALAYRDAYGVDRDPGRSLALLREAALLGNAKAMVHLSLALRCGVGTGKDMAAADRWIRLAIDVVGTEVTGRRLDQARAGWERAAQHPLRHRIMHGRLGRTLGSRILRRARRAVGP